MKPGRGLSSFLLLRILPALLFLMGAVSWLGIYQIERTAITQEQVRLGQVAEMVNQTLGQRIADIQEQACFLAENEFIRGSLVDVRQRTESLPVFFQTLRVSGMDRKHSGLIVLHDFQGNVIVANGPAEGCPRLEAWLHDEVHTDGFWEISESGLVYTHVVLLHGSREGAVRIHLDPDELHSLLGLDQFRDGVLLTLGDGVFSIQNAQFWAIQQDRHITATHLFTEYRLERLIISISDREAFLGALEGTRRLTALLIGTVLIALILFVVFTVRAATSPMRELADSLQSIVEYQDLNRKMEVRGTADILQLGDAINNLLARLKDITASREDLALAAEDQRILLDNIQTQVWYLTDDHTYGAVNEAHAAFNGAKKEDLAFKDMSDIFPEDVVQVCRQGNMEVFSTGRPVRSEEWVPHVSGERRLISVLKSPRLGPDGTVKYVVCSAEDITEKKRAEEALRESEARYDLAISGTGAGLWDWDMVNDRVYFSRQWKAMLGYTDEEIENRFSGWQKLWHPEDAERITRAIQDYLEGRTKTYEIEHRLLHKTDGWLWILTRGDLIRDETGNAVRWTGTNIDLTHFKQVEQALRDSEQKYRLLFENMTAGFALHEMLLDEKGHPMDYRFMEINPAFEHLTGLRAADLLGRTLKEVVPLTESYWIETFGQVAKTGEPLAYENYSQTMGRHFETWVFSPSPGQFAVIFSDVTRRKQAEQLIEAKNRELEQIVYVASHDLRSPLVNVDGYSRELQYTLNEVEAALENAASSPPDLEEKIRSTLPDMKEALRYIRNSTQQMDALLKGLLRLSRSGRAALTIEPLNMTTILAEIATSLDFQIKSARADLRIAELPPCRGDVLQMTQIFTNLIGNALKYLEPKRPGIITVTGEVQKDRSVYCVADNGIGIEPEHQARVFELFHRLNPSRTEGEGMGLTIVRQSLGRMDGDVRVESEYGAGSRFYVSLPHARLVEE